MIPGDANSFRPSLHTPHQQLSMLAEQVGHALGLRVAAPLVLEHGPFGMLLRMDEPAALSWARYGGSSISFPPYPAALTKLRFESGMKIADTGGYFSDANPTRLTAPATGVYNVGAHVWARNNDGTNWHPVGTRYQIRARRWNAAATVSVYFAFSEEVQVAPNGTVPPTDERFLNVQTVLPLAATDFIEFECFQNSTFNSTLSGGHEASMQGWIVRLR